MRDSRAGFTLIELLVVIGILSLLVVAFAPDIIGAQGQADKAADQANLRWHYSQITIYKQRYKTFPRGTGSRWLLDTWVRGPAEHTDNNFRRYFTPGLEDDPFMQELLRQGVDNIWKSPEDITSADTHYAARGTEAKGRAISGRAPWAANDNERGPAFLDGSVNVLMGDGTVKELTGDFFKETYGITPEELEAEGFLVGQGSQDPLLMQLEK